MKILVINAGSSSLKYKFIDMDNNKILANGNCERIGLDNGIITHKRADGKKKVLNVNVLNHNDAFIQVKNLLLDKDVGVISRLNEVSAVGHRVVQGGSLFKEAAIINDDVLKGIESLIPLAPLHNKAHVQGIRACIDVFGKDVSQVAVFDTSFHSTMPPKAYMFAIPYEYYEKYNVRRYGFHGISHRYVSERCASLLNKSLFDVKLITCHLGNGSSITAIDRGRVIDTSMGLTPLDGIMMGTRSGSLDPSVITFIAEKQNLGINNINEILNKKSGLLGISGISNDDRDISKAANNQNKRAELAHQMLRYQIIKYIGSYIAALNGINAIVFTGGIGENDASHREAVCKNFSYLQLEINDYLNSIMVCGKEGKISSDNSKVDVFVIPTNEELLIACDTRDILLKMHIKV